MKGLILKIKVESNQIFDASNVVKLLVSRERVVICLTDSNIWSATITAHWLALGQPQARSAKRGGIYL